MKGNNRNIKIIKLPKWVKIAGTRDKKFQNMYVKMMQMPRHEPEKKKSDD